jgi:formylglycine-generating enzyme
MLLAAVLFAATVMPALPSGSYQPLYGTQRTHVASFSLDRHAVTRGEYRAFVIAHPEWRRGNVRPNAADAHYLDEWKSDLEVEDPSRPVTGISRVAAQAYCAALDKRLPTTDEWEYALTIAGNPARLSPTGGPWEWTAAPRMHHHEMRDASCAGAAMGALDPTNYSAFQRFALRSALTDTTTLRALGFRCAA